MAITATALTMGAMSGFGAAAGSTAGGAASGTAAAGTTTATAATTTAATTAATTSALATGLNAATVAAASSVASQASISAINNQGRLGKVAKDITSKDALKNTAIAAVGAGIAGGALAVINPTPVTATTDLATNLKTSFAEVGTQTLGSTAAQSAINGDSFSEALKNQGKNILIYTVAKVGANQIGAAAHPVDGSTGIGQPLQLALHAGLGCGIGAAAGGNCGSGAVAGVMGELAGEGLKDSVRNGNMSRDDASRLAGLFGGISSVTYGGLTDQSDNQMAQNAWEGSRIGENAAKHNSLSDGFGFAPTDEKLQEFQKHQDEASAKIGELKEKLQNKIADSYVATDSTAKKAVLFPALVATTMLVPGSTEELQLGLITAPLAFGGKAATSLSSGIVSEGTQVFRVWGDGAEAWGRSWTTVDPRSVALDYRNVAGLPNQNTGRFFSEGILQNTQGVISKPADSLHGNIGGWPEIVVPNPSTQIKLQNVQGLNPKF